MVLSFNGLGKIFLLGGGELLTLCALDLRATGADVVVVTSPRQAGELISSGKTLSQQLANDRIVSYSTADINSDANILNLIDDGAIGLSIAASWIFKLPFIRRFEGRLLNCHSMRLPRDRGSGGFSWLIMNGDHEGACLVHQVDEGLDTGPIVSQRTFPYPPACRLPNDYRKTFLAENRLFLRQLFNDIREMHDFPLTHQLHDLSTFWPRLSTEHHGFIDWSWSLQEIERFICAFDEPYHGASTFIKGQRVHVKNCSAAFGDGAFHPFQRGLVYRQSGDTQFVATSQGTLILGAVTDHGGANFSKGISLGDRFYTPIQELESARQFRAVFTPSGLKNFARTH